MAKSASQKRREAKAKRNKKAAKKQQQPASPKILTALTQSSHEDKTNHQANQEPNNHAATKSTTKRTAKRGITVSGWIFGVSTLICGLLFCVVFGYWFSKGYENIRTGFFWLIPASCVLVIAILSGYWHNVVKPVAKAGNPFTVVVVTKIATDHRALGPGFWIRSNNSNARSPIHFLALIRITNLQSVRSMVETYRVEAQRADGTWIKLIRIPGDRGFVYLITDPKQATLLKLSTLDDALDNHAIGPNETVDGWAFFEYPEEIAVKRLRVYLKDFGGAEQQTPPIVGTDDFAQQGGFQGIAKTDLSDATVGYYSEIGNR
jgi:hypothetical protein